MKKVLLVVLALIMVLGIVGCSGTPAKETNTAEPTETTEMIPEPTEKTIEVANDIVTFDDFKKTLIKGFDFRSLDYDRFLRLIEVEDGFSFKYDDDNRMKKSSTYGTTSVYGTIDKDKNLTSLKIVCTHVQVDWIQDKEAIEEFSERYKKADFKSMDSVQLSAFSGTSDALDAVGMVYKLISKVDYVPMDDAVVIRILTSDNPVQVGKWSVSTVADKDNNTVTIEAKYNNK